jgi:hypothetical protein
VGEDALRKALGQEVKGENKTQKQENNAYLPLSHDDITLFCHATNQKHVEKIDKYG